MKFSGRELHNSLQYNSGNYIKCLKTLLKQEIGTDKDKLLAYKSVCIRFADTEETSIIMSVAALIISIFSCLLGAFENPDGRLTIAVIVILVMMVVCGVWVGMSRKYKTIEMVLDDIEREMAVKN